MQKKRFHYTFAINCDIFSKTNSWACKNVFSGFFDIFFLIFRCLPVVYCGICLKGVKCWVQNKYSKIVDGSMCVVFIVLHIVCHNPCSWAGHGPGSHQGGEELSCSSHTAFTTQTEQSEEEMNGKKRHWSFYELPARAVTSRLLIKAALCVS